MADLGYATLNGRIIAKDRKSLMNEDSVQIKTPVMVILLLPEINGSPSKMMVGVGSFGS